MYSRLGRIYFELYTVQSWLEAINK
jgi:hypothetical protein